MAREGAPVRTLRTGEFWAVDDVSFRLERGQCLGLIGRNGAGKTTLLRLLSGLIRPDRGRIEVRGRVGAVIALGAGFNPVLTGRENIYVNASVLGLRKHEIDRRLDEIVDFAELGEFIDAPVQSYSSGMQVRLGFAIASSLDPDVLLLDEVLAVGDAAFRAKCFNRIHQTLKTAAVIFVSHNMSQVVRICDRLLLMAGGKQLAHSDDLGGVVARYHALTDTSFNVVSSGTGDARLAEIRLEDGSGHELTRIRRGADVDIVLDVHLTEKARVADLRVLVVIVDQEQEHVAQILHTLDLRDHGARVSIRMRIENVLLSPGHYSLAVGLLIGPRGELGHSVQNVLTFVVEGSAWTYAPVTLQTASVVVTAA